MSFFDFPLADLHRHLDGSLRPSTIVELDRLLFSPLHTMPDIENLRFKPRMGLQKALTRFAYTLALLQKPEHVRRVTAEICEDAAEDGVTTLEIRLAPQLHTNEAPLEAIVDAAVEGAAGRAGIILCGLHGEAPETIEKLVGVAITRTGVVGIDLAACGTPDHKYTMKDYVYAFRRAESHGIGRTVHAGEGGPATEIRDAIELLHAQRIGHGTTLLYEPEVVDLVLERDVVIEVCPTSNVHTGVIPSVSDHPLSTWLDLGVRTVICPDNTFFSNVTASEEYGRTLNIPGMTIERLQGIAQMGHHAAFRR